MTKIISKNIDKRSGQKKAMISRDIKYKKIVGDVDNTSFKQEIKQARLRDKLAGEIKARILAAKTIKLF